MNRGRKPFHHVLALLAAGALTGAVVFAQEVLPRPEQPFGGKIGRTTKESTKDFPKPIHAPKGAPNILLILTDDVGFAASSTFGGPIPTVTMDRLATSGLRYNQFHTTALAFRLSLDEGLDCGEDTGTPITEDYQVPFKFTGELKKAVIDLTPPNPSADEQSLKAGTAAIRVAE